MFTASRRGMATRGNHSLVIERSLVAQRLHRCLTTGDGGMRRTGLTRGIPALTLVAMACAAGGCGEDPPARVSAREQRALPTDQLALGENLCPREWDETKLPAREVGRRKATGRRQLAALEAAYASHPDALVRTTYASSDEGPGSEDITVRALARTHLEGVTEPGLSRSRCFKRVAQRLRTLLGR